jgi:hypothetical protein
MSKPKIFVSFDFDEDRQYRYLLNAFSSNPHFDFTFDDKSSGFINSSNIPTIKAALTRKINEAHYTLVIIGKEANKIHKDHVAIGYRNWQNYEIAKSKEVFNQLIAIKIDQSYASPDEILCSNAKWAYSFTIEGIQKALQ